MPRTATAAAAALVGAGGFFAQLPTGDSHAYMMIPVSRQLWGTSAFQEVGSPDINYCPHCFQSRGPAAIRARGGDKPWPHFNGERAENGNYIESEEVAQRHGICGDPEQTAAEDSNKYGLENSNYPVLETYAEGGILEFKMVVSTYHWGHVEMFLCDADDLPGGPDSTVTQSCFNEHPLDRVDDDDFNSPIDPSNTGRFILDPPCRASETDQEMLDGAFPGDVATARFKLPQGLTCERCVVQMVYYTGNSCKHQGYAEFNPESWPSSCAPTKADWINEVVGHCGDGDAYPEEFWNCADISITSDGDPAPSPTTVLTPAPTAPEETEPPATDVPTAAPSSATTSEGEEEEEETGEPTPAPIAIEGEDTDVPTSAPTTSQGEEADEPTYAPTSEGDREEENTDGPTPAPTIPEGEETDLPTSAPTTVQGEEADEPTYAPTFEGDREEEDTDGPTPAPTIAEGEETDQPTSAPTTSQGEEADEPTYAPTSGEEEDTDGPTPAPTIAEGEETDQPTSAPTTVQGEEADEPTYAPTSEGDREEEDTDGPTPAPTIPEGEETDLPTSAPTTAHGGEANEPTYAPTSAGDREEEDTDGPTPAPTIAEGEEGEETDEPTPAPTTELEPATIMASPTEAIVATFAPSVPPPVSTDPDCEDPVGGFNQCGGPGYEGSTCCRTGYDCEQMADCYFECRPRGDRCSESWGQCGGLDWEGPECCWPGARCAERNEWYYQCIPEDAIYR
ncbi:EsV-1-166 [Ectocarpus siliculosus]|uniref:EsV-1-166 n=1 Tax=Ectocarpus siliculosus TaxID=2880 RepID=D8LM92_ECTSI|nr:EsV-1-166 [Ectocarpus siliculosus]|eukprot:CBN77502.1 EsV-1-166 [Ectocarpus siliculosus]